MGFFLFFDKVTDDMAIDFYLKSDLPEKSYFKSLAGCAIRGYLKTADAIIKDKINKDNIDLAISEYEDFYQPSDKESIEYMNYMLYLDRLCEIKK